MPQHLPSQPNAVRSRPRLGCLVQLVLALALGAALLILITAVFAPWGFFLGGGFHVIPYWQGWGTMQATSGTYALFVRFEPAPSRSRIMPGPSVKGVAYLCSPRGQTFRMNLGGGMRRGIGTNTDGEKISLYMDNWPALTGGFKADHRPALEIRGQWKNPNIVADDHGSLSRAFDPDGTVSSGHDPHRPYPGPIVSITLSPGSYREFEQACQSR